MMEPLTFVSVSLTYHYGTEGGLVGKEVLTLYWFGGKGLYLAAIFVLSFVIL